MPPWLWLCKMNFNREFENKSQPRHPVGLSSKAMTLNNWKGQKFARYLYDSEQTILQQATSQLAGYRLMHLGVAADQCGLQASKQLHQFYVRPSSEPLSFDSSYLVSDYADLPLPSSVVEVAVLQHALEYSYSPQAVLAESARVLAPGGHLILCVINPLSPIGLMKLPMGLLSKRPEYHFSGLRKGRIKDWLSLLNFQIIQIADGAYSWPLEQLASYKKDSLWERGCHKAHLPWGNFYMIQAVKRVAGGVSNTPRPWKARVSGGYVSPSKKINLKE